MYETTIGFVEVIDGTSRGQTILATEKVMDQAWSFAIDKLTALGKDEKAISEMVANNQITVYHVPETHPSFARGKDVIRGWVGAMIDQELKLLSSYAVRKN